MVLCEEFPEDFQGVDIERRFGVEFYVAENPFCDFIPEGSGQGDEHGFGKGLLHEAFDCVTVFPDEGLQVTCLGTEAQGDGQFQKEMDVETAEVGLHGVQQHDALLTPLIKTLLHGPFLNGPIQNLAQEHGHGILEHIVPYACQGMLRGEISGRIKR